MYPYKPQFYYKKVEFKVVKIILACFRGLVGHSISYKIVTAPSEDSAQPPGPALTTQSLRCPFEDTLDPWLPLKCQAKVLIRLRAL